MQIFKINEKISIVCEWKKTRSAFKHTATLMINELMQDETKICYCNRTWERYDFESVLRKMINGTKELSKEEKTICLDFVANYKESDNGFNAIAMVAKMGDILCPNQKKKNDWKTRMLKAGLENKGLIMPDDWNELNETDKENRLNNVIAELTKIN